MIFVQNACQMLMPPDTASATVNAPMPVSDLDIARTAHQWIQLHGDSPTAKAREMVEAMQKKGNADGADVWLRIVAAITTLGEPSTLAKD